MLKHTRGDLLELAESGEFDIIVQGCNCFNTMGGGIARTIREKYPNAAYVDHDTQRGDYNKLGNYTLSWSNGFDGFIIVNAYTQFDMSTGEDVFEYTAFKLILQKLAKQFPTGKFGFPMIGAGLARGNWERIVETLTQFAIELAKTGGTVSVVEYSVYQV